MAARLLAIWEDIQAPCLRTELIPARRQDVEVNFGNKKKNCQGEKSILDADQL